MRVLSSLRNPIPEHFLEAKIIDSVKDIFKGYEDMQINISNLFSLFFLEVSCKEHFLVREGGIVKTAFWGSNKS